MSSNSFKDLVIMVADNDIRAVMKELIGERYLEMGIRSVEFDILPESFRDSDCRTKSHDILRKHCGNYQHALVVFDLRGSGGEGRSRTERDVENNLAPNGWPYDRAAAVVIDPELEAWIWCNPDNLQFVRRSLGVQPRTVFARPAASAGKEPKNAFQMACRQARKRRSPERYRELAERLPVRNCQDHAFQKLMTTLQRWFP